jgi:hypothetical protein
VTNVRDDLAVRRSADLVRVVGLGRTMLYGAIRDRHRKPRKYRSATLVLREDLVMFLEGLPNLFPAPQRRNPALGVTRWAGLHRCLRGARGCGSYARPIRPANIQNDENPARGVIALRSRMADIYDPPRIEERTEFEGALTVVITSNIDIT